jgi:hypothetical protein
MDTCLDGLECSQEEFYQAFDVRMEDAEEDVQILKGDVDDFRIKMDLQKWDIGDVESSVENAHHQLGRVEDHMDGLAWSIRLNAAVAASSSWGSLGEAHRVEWELRPITEGWFGKLERCNTIIDKRFILFEEELDKVTALVGEKIQSGMEDLSSKFSEALEAEGRWYGVLARDMELLKS